MKKISEKMKVKLFRIAVIVLCLLGMFFIIEHIESIANGIAICFVFAICFWNYLGIQRENHIASLSNNIYPIKQMVRMQLFTALKHCGTSIKNNFTSTYDLRDIRLYYKVLYKGKIMDLHKINRMCYILPYNLCTVPVVQVPIPANFITIDNKKTFVEYINRIFEYNYNSASQQTAELDQELFDEAIQGEFADYSEFLKKWVKNSKARGIPIIFNGQASFVDLFVFDVTMTTNGYYFLNIIFKNFDGSQAVIEEYRNSNDKGVIFNEEF